MNKCMQSLQLSSCRVWQYAVLLLTWRQNRSPYLVCRTPWKYPRNFTKSLVFPWLTLAYGQWRRVRAPRINPTIMIAGLITVLLPVYAQAADKPFPLPWFEKARVLYQVEGQRDDYLLALGPFKKADGQWRVEQSRQLEGDLYRATLEVNKDHRASEAYRFYRDLMLEYNARLLFSCEGWECGSSNTWANEYFEVRQLYGEDSEQKYAVYEYIRNNHRYIFTLYTVTRGNKRAYAQLDILQLAKGDQTQLQVRPEAIVEQLKTQGAYRFSSVTGDGQTLTLPKAEMDAVVIALKSLRQFEVAVVVEVYQSGTFTQLLQLSNTMADKLRLDLIAAGVSERQLQAYGAGNLVPDVHWQGAYRVSLVVGKH